MISSDITFRFASGDAREAWSAMKVRPSRASKPRSYEHHASRLSKVMPKLTAPGSVKDHGWRDGLRRLYCQTLSHALSRAIFSQCMIGGGPVRLETAFASVSPKSILPSSWLQVGSAPPSNVERLRAAIVQRLEFVERPSEGKALKRTKGQSLILDKAA